MTLAALPARILTQSVIDQLTNGLLNGLSFQVISQRVVEARRGAGTTDTAQLRTHIIVALRQLPHVFREISQQTKDELASVPPVVQQ